jgi:sirohydrochlorin cobaltochelatase
MTQQIILFSHGSRDAQWRLPIEAVAERIRLAAPTAQVRCAYLELCSPTLLEAATDLIATAAGNTRAVTVFPLFLGVGKHAREDLPVLMQEVRAAHPDTVFNLLPTAGESPELLALLAQLALAD